MSLKQQELLASIEQHKTELQSQTASKLQIMEEIVGNLQEQVQNLVVKLKKKVPAKP